MRLFFANLAFSKRGHPFTAGIYRWNDFICLATTNSCLLPTNRETLRKRDGGRSRHILSRGFVFDFRLACPVHYGNGFSDLTLISRKDHERQPKKNKIPNRFEGRKKKKICKVNILCTYHHGMILFELYFGGRLLSYICLFSSSAGASLMVRRCVVLCVTGGSCEE